ncbi:MAG: EscU/YscU/HrcU family type III secretion system export apparatus switch protein [Alphaproteobacteria bacterium]|nr:EscU/YscU/HrcU family type III secretion system export apparatus switch protein [Alphaproteobacteria bacterium]
MTTHDPDPLNPAADDPLKPLNIKEKSKRQTAVALKDRTLERKVPQVVAAGRGKIAEQILQLAYDNDIRIREDSALAEMLAAIEIDSPIPPEAFSAVAEIMSYVYRANGQPNPFDALLTDDKKKEDKGTS